MPISTTTYLAIARAYYANRCSNELLYSLHDYRMSLLLIEWLEDKLASPNKLYPLPALKGKKQ